MAHEEKELLLIDLSARLPYHTIVSTGEEDLELVKVDILNGLVYVFSESFLEFDAFEIKPYLRPMSSMTEEERRELCNIRPCYINSDDIVNGTQCNNFIQASECQDWLNAHHFDYRGLIEKGLALEAKEGMYET